LPFNIRNPCSLNRGFFTEKMTPLRRTIKRWLLGCPRPPAGEVRSILVVRRNGIGGMVCALPVLRAPKKVHPKAQLTVLADEANAPVARLCEAVDEVLVFPLRPRLFHGRSWEAWRTARELRGRGFDLAVGVSGSFSRLLAQIVYGTGAGIRAGTLPPERVAEPFYYSHYRVRHDASRTHQIQTGVEILSSMGIACDPGAIRLNIPTPEIDRAKSWLISKLDPARPLVWLHLSNRRAESRWSAEDFKELARQLIEKTDANIVLARAAGDSDFDPAFFESLPRNRVACFENKSFLKFAAALSQARVAVCGDGGVMHLAAALGVSVVALFSATEPEIWRPWGDQHRVIRRGDNVNLINVDEVFTAVAESLKPKP
jgi:ADP-heptose:LPS heptosyltransferase